MGTRRRTGTWTGCLRRNCVWKSGWSRSYRRRTGTGTGTSQSQSRMKTVTMTWRNWKQKLMRRMSCDAFVPGLGRLTHQVSSWETWIGATGPSTHRLASPVAPQRRSPSLVVQLDGSVAVGTGASASPCPCPGPCPCLGLGVAGPSHLAWLSLSPTPLSSAAAPCPVPAPVPARALSACARALGHALGRVPVPVVCSLALAPSLGRDSYDTALLLYTAP